MNEKEITWLTSYHEAGHIISSATIGKWFKCSMICSPERGYTDYFITTERQIESARLSCFAEPFQQSTVPGAVDKSQLMNRGPQIPDEEALLIAHSDRPLEDYLQTYAAGVEASVIYADERGLAEEQIEQIKAEANDPDTEDMKRMLALIKVHNRQDECQKLLDNAKYHARTLLLDTNVWNYVIIFAELLFNKRIIQWHSLPEEHRQILNDLMAKGKKL